MHDAAASARAANDLIARIEHDAAGHDGALPGPKVIAWRAYITALFEWNLLDAAALAALYGRLAALSSEGVPEVFEHVVPPSPGPSALADAVLDDPQLARLHQFGAQLGDMPSLDSILPVIVRLLSETLRVPYAAIYLRRVDSDEDELAAECATDESLVPALALELPIERRDETIGRLAIGFFDDAQRPGDNALRVLQEFVRRAASAVWAVRLMHDLRRAREQLVFAREEERRLLRRNLHDTIGPTLAALNLRSNALRKLIESNPPAASQQMGEFREQIRSVITDIRRVVYNLRPPALDELGLVSAIREQARQFSVDLFQVFVDAPESMPPINAASEVAAYRIVSEGLANVVRHANARKCWIKLAHDDEALRVEILDDGIGMSMDGHMGVGLQSMRQRARELGGRCTFQSAPGQGMLVRASLPFSTGALPPDEMIGFISDQPGRAS